MSVPSVTIAKDRLRNLLITDRIQCTPDMIEFLTSDLYQTISKYIEISPEQFDVKITRTDIHIKYTGEKQTQEVEQVLVNGKALNKEDYEVLDNQATKEGKHVLTIKAKGNNHTGSFKYSYAILPKENDKIGTGSFTVKTT